jgi:hypothetical protein
MAEITIFEDEDGCYISCDECGGDLGFAPLSDDEVDDAADEHEAFHRNNHGLLR